MTSSGYEYFGRSACMASRLTSLAASTTSYRSGAVRILTSSRFVTKDVETLAPFS